MEYQVIIILLDKIMEVLKNSKQNNSETVTNEMIKKYLKKDIFSKKNDKKLLI